MAPKEIRKKNKKSEARVKTAPSGAGVKFTEKYGAKLASNYQIDPDKLIIPPKGHALYDPDGNTTFDEVRVKYIDEQGQCVRIVTVWSDPDAGKLYIIAGRGNVFDVREVNRRRKERGDALITIQFVRFQGDLDQAVDFVAMENFRRKRPSAIHLAREILRYHKLGRAWSKIAEILQLDGEDEKALKARVPIAYCIPEVVEAIEHKRMSIKKAKKFGGRAMDGTQALSRDEQLALLERLLKDKATKKKAGATKSTVPRIGPSHRAEIASRLANGKANHLKDADLAMARFGAALIRYIDGDRSALDYAPGHKAIIDAVLAPPEIDLPPLEDASS